MFYMSAPSKPCNLLSLPREIRDEIYECVLTEEEGLWCSIGSGNNLDTESWNSFRCYTRKDLSSNCESNQLRYVSRQLYYETRGLSLRYSDLIFESTALFCAFLSTCAARHIGRLRNIAINEHIAPQYGKCFPLAYLPSLISPSLSAFCAAHPDVAVSVLLDYFNTSTDFGDWIIFGGAIHYAVQGNLPDALEENGRIRTALVAYKKMLVRELGTGKLVGGLRLQPSGMVDAEEWGKGVSRYGFALTGMERIAWVRQIKKWCKEGF
jgi:hypothetical protein